MGKPPLTDEERRIKDLTRELHEQTQAALAAAKELRDAHDGLSDTIDMLIVASVNKRTAEINAHLDQGYKLITETKQAAQSAVDELTAVATGFPTYEEGLEAMARLVAETVASPEFVASIADNVCSVMNELIAGDPSSMARAEAIFTASRYTSEAMKRIKPSITVTTSAIDGRPPGVYFSLQK